MNKYVGSKILIVDDVADNIKVLRNALEAEGYDILIASDGETALKIAKLALPDIILLDIMMPVMDGYEVCRRLKKNEATGHIPVIFITVLDDNISLAKAFQSGGVDYIPKPFDKEEVLVRVENHLKISHLTQELFQKNKELQEEISRREEAEQAHKMAAEALRKADEHLSIISQQEAARWGIEAYVGKSEALKKILDEVRLIQNIGTTSVLITGESGTGKELIARAIHFGSARAKAPFIPVNCSSINRELAESHFFGHVRGAFSGAIASHKGYFEQADGGTLFLDEIGDMPIELQPKLLRVIEDGLIMPVGGVNEKHVDVRIVAATNQNLLENISKGTFRQDLYFRLERFKVAIPPLRDRKEDIPLLVDHFIATLSLSMGISNPIISPEALSALENYYYPGNIRELRNIIERALIKSRGLVIKPEHLQFIEVNNISSDQPVIPWKAEKNILTDEEKIIDYIHQHGSINNAQCRDLLSVNRRRATYLLEKIHNQGLLTRKDSHRWTQYQLRVNEQSTNNQ